MTKRPTVLLSVFLLYAKLAVWLIDVMVHRHHFIAIRRDLTDPALCGDDAVDDGCDNDVANDDPDCYPDYAPPPTLVAQEGLKRPLTGSVLVRFSLFNGRITTQRIQ